MGYTNGPWKARNNGAHWNNNEIDNWVIEYGYDGEQVVDHVYNKEDANLIAAAPDMYEALVAVSEMVDATSGIGDIVYSALKKARGENK